MNKQMRSRKTLQDAKLMSELKQFSALMTRGKFEINNTFLQKLDHILCLDLDRLAPYGAGAQKPSPKTVSMSIVNACRDRKFVAALGELHIYAFNCISRDADQWVFAITVDTGNSYAFKIARKDAVGTRVRQYEMMAQALLEYLDACLSCKLRDYLFFAGKKDAAPLRMDGTYKESPCIDGTESDIDAPCEPMPSMPLGGNTMTLDQAPLGLKEAFMATLEAERKYPIGSNLVTTPNDEL